jgi:hypothetical protein
MGDDGIPVDVFFVAAIEVADLYDASCQLVIAQEQGKTRIRPVRPLHSLRRLAPEPVLDGDARATQLVR